MINTLNIPNFLFIFRKENNQYIPIVNEVVIDHSLHTKDGWYVMNTLTNTIRFMGNKNDEIVTNLRKYYLYITKLRKKK